MSRIGRFYDILYMVRRRHKENTFVEVTSVMHSDITGLHFVSELEAHY